MKRFLMLSAALIIVPSVAAAQSAADIAGHAALVRTPVGALPPIATSTIERETQSGAELSLRYGYMSLTGASLNNFGASGVLPVSRSSTVTLTGGVAACGGCTAGLLLGIAGDMHMGDARLGSARDAARLAMALNGEFGYASTLHSLSGAVGLPISLVMGPSRRDELRLVPFITPGFGFGSSDSRVFVLRAGNQDDATSGARPMIGGGIGVYNRSSSVAVDFGFQYVAITNGKVLFGLGLRLGQ